MDLNATPGSASANSYSTVEEAEDYFSGRIAIPEWDSAESQEALLMMATRILESVLSVRRALVRGEHPYYRTMPTWTGAVASSTQALMWPRAGMFTRTGADILDTVIPNELKWATAELAGQLAKGDRTSDNDIAVQGITSVRAGSVALTFKDMVDTTKVLPDFVLDLLVPSWLTEEVIEWAWSAEFDVVS